MEATQRQADWLLTADDFLILFPSAPPPVPASELLLSPEHDEDPAAAKRLEKPITKRVLAEELAPYRLLSAVYRVNKFFRPWLPGSLLQGMAFATLSWAAMLAAVIVLNETFGLFGQRQLIAGTVAALFPWVMDMSSVAMAKHITIRLNKLRTDPKLSVQEMNVAPAQLSEEDDLSFHPFAPLVRYLQAVSPRGPMDLEEAKQTSDTNSSLLLQHVDDALCPCSTCIGSNITMSCALLCLADQSLFFLFALTSCVTISTYTPFITFGSLWWSLWWTKLITAIYGEIWLSSAGFCTFR
jgi:hypothetical protein